MVLFVFEKSKKLNESKKVLLKQCHLYPTTKKTFEKLFIKHTKSSVNLYLAATESVIFIEKYNVAIMRMACNYLIENEYIEAFFLIL